MAKTFISVLYEFLALIVGQFLGPVFTGLNSLISSLGLTSFIQMFNSVLYDYVGPMVGFFFEFMGPRTISVLALEFAVYVAYYGITMMTTWILKLFNLIKKFPFA